MSMTQEQGEEILGGLCAELDCELRAIAPGLDFAVVFWNRGRHDDRLATSLFSRPETQPVAPEAIRTAARATQEAASGLTLHGLDTPERVCFYEQDFYVLSNFSAFNVDWDGWRFQTVEHAYHHAKFPIECGMLRAQIREAPSAHEAFRMAQLAKASRRPDWDEIKVDVMRDLIRAKAEQHEYVRRKLLQTGARELVENSWRDDFWGWGPNRDGQNMLGKLWMEIRAEIRAGYVASAVEAGYVDPNFKP